MIAMQNGGNALSGADSITKHYEDKYVIWYHIINSYMFTYEFIIMRCDINAREISIRAAG